MRAKQKNLGPELNNDNTNTINYNNRLYFQRVTHLASKFNLSCFCPF